MGLTVLDLTLRHRRNTPHIQCRLHPCEAIRCLQRGREGSERRWRRFPQPARSYKSRLSTLSRKIPGPNTIAPLLSPQGDDAGVEGLAGLNIVMEPGYLGQGGVIDLCNPSGEPPFNTQGAYLMDVDRGGAALRRGASGKGFGGRLPLQAYKVCRPQREVSAHEFHGAPSIEPAARAATAAACGSYYARPSSAVFQSPWPLTYGASATSVSRTTGNWNFAGRPVPRQVAGESVLGTTGRGPPPRPQQTLETAPNSAESPVYVNAKQFHRILKRPAARQKREVEVEQTSKRRKTYLHESRHNHAKRRPRGPGGRFLKAEEIAVPGQGRETDTKRWQSERAVTR